LCAINHASVNIPTVADSHDRNDQFLIKDFVENPVISLTQPVFFLTGQFFATRWPRVIR
jgi:hypothetical protein